MQAGLTVDLSPGTRRGLLATLSLINVGLATATAIFIAVWAKRASYSEAVQSFITHILVQGHLATENVLAAWYSAMLLLAVGLAALLAFWGDTRQARGPLRWGWLLVAAVFLTLSIDEIGSFHERIGMLRFLSPSREHAMGWVFVLAIPIAVVGLFLLGFAWLHVRVASAAFWWIAVGVVLFGANPVVERVEESLTRGRDAQHGTWAPVIHDTVIVVEEGGLELFGTVCFLMGVLGYIATTAGDRSVWTLEERSTRVVVRVLTALLAAGTFLSTRVVRALPPADGGIPANWFPAAAFFLVALALTLRRNATHRSRWWIPLPLSLSGYCGAGLYGYSALLHHGQPHIALIATLIAGWMLEGTLTGVPSGTSNVSAGHQGR